MTKQQLTNALTIIKLSANIAQDYEDKETLLEAMQGIEQAATFILQKLEQEKVVE